MITSVADERIKNVRVTDDELVVALADGRTLSVPLVWYPRLLNASAAQRSDWELIGDGGGVHWPQIDEDLSVAGLLRGVPAPASGAYMATVRGDTWDAAVQNAQTFYRQSIDSLKSQIQNYRAQLEQFSQQVPYGTAQGPIQEIIDSYLILEGLMDQAAEDMGVEDTMEQAAQQTQQQIQQSAQDHLDETVEGVQDAVGDAPQQVQDTIGGAAQKASL